MSTCSYELVPKFDSAKSFYGKAIVENQTDGYAYVLISYGVKVAAIEYGTGTAVLFPDWCYSATTLRHVKEFLQQHGHAKMTKQQIIKRGNIVNGNIVLER